MIPTYQESWNHTMPGVPHSGTTVSDPAPEDGSAVARQLASTLSGMARTAEIHVTVGPDGSLSVPATRLADAGIHAGEAVVVVLEPRRRVRSMLGAHDRGVDFDVEDQRAIRAEMAVGLGEDLTR
jgi:hypothetical protein